MLKFPTKNSVVGSITGLLALSPNQADAYPIDCAILLCLAGGWPAGPVCTAAKVEFIRRITPIPIEAPLQIWNCPLASYDPQDPIERLWYAVHKGTKQAAPAISYVKPAVVVTTPPLTDLDTLPVRPLDKRQMKHSIAPAVAMHHLANDVYSGQADIDISGPDYDFIRSIRVWNVEAFSVVSGSDDDECHAQDATRLGTYGLQGSFAWEDSTMGNTPAAFEKPRGFGGGSCLDYHVTSVFIEWRDHSGKYGWERVDY